MAPGRKVGGHYLSVRLFTPLAALTTPAFDMQEVIGAGLGAPSPCRAVPGRRPIGTHRSRVATPVRAAAACDSISEHGLTGRRQALLAGAALAGGLVLPGGARWSGAAVAAESQSIYDLSAQMFGEEVPLSRYKDQVRRDERCGQSCRALLGKCPAEMLAEAAVDGNAPLLYKRVSSGQQRRCRGERGRGGDGGWGG